MSELYELPDGWEWTNFKDSLYLTDFVANGSFASLKENVSYLNKKDYAILVRLKDFSNKWNGDYVYVDKHSYDFLSKSSLNENDIMMCNVGSVGLHFRVPNLGQPMTIGPNSILIRPQIDNLSNSFLYYYFASNIFKNFLETIVATTAQPKFNKTGFKTLSIPLPPLPEQQRIVSKLDLLFEKIDRSIALHQKNMDEANVSMGSVLNDVFGELEENYDKHNIESIVQIIDGDRGSNYPKKDEFFDDEYCLFLSARNVTKNGFVFKEMQFITKEKDSLLRKGKLQRNDLVLTTRGTIGNVAFYNEEIPFENIRLNSGMVILRIYNEKITQRFLYIFLNSPSFHYFLNEIQNGSAQPQISITNFKNLFLPVPPLPIQQKTVTYLDEISQKIEKIKQLQKEKMDSLKALKASILDSAFRGEL